MLSEIIRVSAMMPNLGFNELDGLRHRSPSPMSSSNLLSNVAGWNGLPQEVVGFLVQLVSRVSYNPYSVDAISLCQKRNCYCVIYIWYFCRLLRVWDWGGGGVRP